MASQEITLSSSFRGLNRRVQAASLGENESSDCTDCAPSGRRVGTLGARLGRTRITDWDERWRPATLLGAGVLNTFQTIRVLAGSNNGRTTLATSYIPLIINIARSTTTVTVNFAVAPGLQVGDSIQVTLDSTDSDYSTVSALEGLYVVTATATPTRITYTHGVSGTIAQTTIGGNAFFSGMDDTARYRFVQYGRSLYAFNGRNRPRFTAGAGFGLMGIDKSVFTPSVTPDTTGISGTYRYYVVPFTANVRDLQGRVMEGLPSTISPEVTVSNKRIVVGNIPATHPNTQVQGWNVYRNLSGSYDYFYYIGSVTLGTTTYNDTKADTDINPAVELTLRQDTQNTPPTCKYIVPFGERLFAFGFDPITTGTTTINVDTTKFDFTGVTLADGCRGCYFQIVGDPQVYVIDSNTTNQITLTGAYNTTYQGSPAGASYSIFRPSNEINFSEWGDWNGWGRDGEIYRNKRWLPAGVTITGGAVFQGNLLIFTATDIYVIQGQGPNNDDIRILPDPLFRGIGCVSHDTIVHVDNELHWLSWRGPVAIRNGAPEETGATLNTDWIDTISAANMAGACAGTDDRNIWFSWPSLSTAGGTAYNSKTLRYERDTQSWWEETEIHPTLYVRVNSSDGRLDTLHYLQGPWLIRPNFGTTDCVAGPFSGTIGVPISAAGCTITIAGNVMTVDVTSPHYLATGDIISFTSVEYPLSNGTHTVTAVDSDTFSFPFVAANSSASSTITITVLTFASTSSFNAGLDAGGTNFEQVYVRLFRAGNFIGSRLVITSTSIQIFWSTNAALPGSGALTIHPGDTYEISNVWWKWKTREVDDVAQLLRVQDMAFMFDQQSDTLQAQVTQFINGVERVVTVSGTDYPRKETVTQRTLTQRLGSMTAVRSFALRIESRNYAVLQEIGLTMTAETTNK